MVALATMPAQMPVGRVTAVVPAGKVVDTAVVGIAVVTAPAPGTAVGTLGMLGTATVDKEGMPKPSWTAWVVARVAAIAMMDFMVVVVFLFGLLLNYNISI